MKMTFRYLACALLSLVLFAGSVQATPVDGLYDAEVSVPNTSESERGPAFARALEQVLVRASGSSGVLQRPGVDEILANAEKLVQAYSYQRAGQESEALRLSVTFGAVGVARALVSVDAPVWGANRPVVLAWVAAQSRSGRALAVGSSRNDAGAGVEWGSAMERAARQKGVPLVLPEFDEKDQRIVNLSDIWGLFLSPIEKASERYRSDLLAVTRISETAGGYNARWSLKGAGVTLDGQVQGNSPEAVTEAVVAAWAEALANRYAIAPGGDDTLQVVDMVVEGVDSLDAYAQIRKSLAAMEPISKAAPVRVTGDTLRIRVSFNGELTLLKEHLALERRLTRQQAIQQAAPSQTPEPLVEQEQASGTEPGAKGGEPAGQPPVLDPSFKPIPAPGEPIIATGPAGGELQDKTEDFRSLYPVLYFRWMGNQEEERSGQQQVPVRASR